MSVRFLSLPVIPENKMQLAIASDVVIINVIPTCNETLNEDLLINKSSLLKFIISHIDLV